MKMKNATEQKIQKAIIDYLKLKKYVVFKHRNVGIFKQATKQYIPLSFGEKGITDIIACDCNGRFWGIEVKRKGGKVSPDQADFIARIRKNGGIAFVAYSLEEVIQQVERTNKGNMVVSVSQSVDNPLLKNKVSKKKNLKVSA